MWRNMTTISGNAIENVLGPTPAVVTSVSVSLTTGTIGPGGTDTATARLNGGAVATLPSNATIAWTSDKPTVATVTVSASNPLQATVAAVDGGVPEGQETQVTITATVTQ